MSVFRHRFVGKCAAGDTFVYQWYAESIRTIAQAQLAAVAWNAAVWNGATAGNGYKDHVTADVSMLTVITAEIAASTGKQLQRAETAQVIAGVAAGNSLSADCCMVVSLRSSLPQRTGRGRFYMPQPAALNLTTQGRITADMTNDILAALTAAWGAYDTGIDRPVIYSPTFRLTRPIISFDIPDLFTTQRRRENKVTQTRVTAAMP